jgi:mannose-6-phosphate isomerase-like protein (cupin superfamily)
MLSFLKGAEMPRTKRAHLTTFTMENGRSSVSFRNDPTLKSDKASIAFTLPPCEPGDDPKDNSIMIPQFHIHPNQVETFLITSGTALFHVNRKRVPISAGNTIDIPRGEYHRFTNASTTESMTLEAWYDPPELVREERLFRNLCGYLEDNRGDDGGGMAENASIPQLALFAWEADMMMCKPSKFPFSLSRLALSFAKV